MHNPKQFFYGLKIIAFLSEHPKSDQNLKFLLLKVTTSNTVIFIWESGIQTIVKKLHRFEIHSSLKLSRTTTLFLEGSSYRKSTVSRNKLLPTNSVAKTRGCEGQPNKAEFPIARVIGSSKKIPGSKEKNSFYGTVTILITFNCRNVK